MPVAKNDDVSAERRCQITEHLRTLSTVGHVANIVKNKCLQDFLWKSFKTKDKDRTMI
jgi:hypothetical protein